LLSQSTAVSDKDTVLVIYCGMNQQKLFCLGLAQHRKSPLFAGMIVADHYENTLESTFFHLLVSIRSCSAIV
jgi:hypothetical protein